MIMILLQAKLEKQEYDSIAAFEADFNLMVNNCLAYNRKDTMFYRAGMKMKEQGGSLIDQTRKDYPELDPGIESEQIGSKKKRERSSRSRAEMESQSNEKEIGGGGVNRRTAVLFTRKARARNAKSSQMFLSEDDRKKQSDSFKIYRYVNHNQ